MAVLLTFTSSRFLIRFLRWPIMISVGVLVIFGAYWAALAGLSVEEFNIGGLWDTPGGTWHQARDETWHWSQHVGWLFWVFLADLILEVIVYRSDKKANG